MESVVFDVIIRVLPMMLGLFTFMVAFQYCIIRIERKIKQKRGETTGERIARLSSALNESIELTNEIEREIVTRHEMVEKLKEDIERYEILSRVKSPEVEAIAQAIRGEIQQEGNKSLIKSTIINFIFFAAGVCVTLFLA